MSIKKSLLVTVTLIMAAITGCKKTPAESYKEIDTTPKDSEQTSYTDTTKDTSTTETYYPAKPPNFPELPSNYTEWFEYISYSGVEDSPHFDEYNVDLKTVEDTFNPPYSIKPKGFNHFWGEVDSLFGTLHYYTDTNCTSLSVDGKGAVFIQWHPHEEMVDTSMSPFYVYGTGYFNYIAHEKTGVKRINVAGRKALRLRGWWWETQCDDYYQAVGSFTTYYMPTQKLDFRITCLTQFYERDPDYWPEGVGYEDAIPEDWTYEKKGPDPIRELERAVEETFKVRE